MNFSIFDDSWVPTHDNLGIEGRAENKNKLERKGKSIDFTLKHIIFLLERYPAYVVENQTPYARDS